MNTPAIITFVIAFLLAGCSRTERPRELYIEIPDNAALLTKTVIQNEFSKLAKEYGNAMASGQVLDKITSDRPDDYIGQFGFGDNARNNTDARLSCQIQRRNIDERRPVPLVLNIYWPQDTKAPGPVPYSTIANNIITALANAGIEPKYIGATNINFYGQKIKDD